MVLLEIPAKHRKYRRRFCRPWAKAIAARAVRPKKKPCGNNGLRGRPLGRGGILGALNNLERGV